MGDSKSRESRGTFGNENIAWVQLGADYDSMWHLVFTSRPCLLFPDPWNDSIQSDSASGVSFPPGSLSPAMTFFPNFRLPYPSGSLSGHHPHSSSNLTCLKLVISLSANQIIWLGDVTSTQMSKPYTPTHSHSSFRNPLFLIIGNPKLRLFSALPGLFLATPSFHVFSSDIKHQVPCSHLCIPPAGNMFPSVIHLYHTLSMTLLKYHLLLSLR